MLYKANDGVRLTSPDASGDSEEAITEIKAVPFPVALPVIDPNAVPGTKILEVVPM